MSRTLTLKKIDDTHFLNSYTVTDIEIIKEDFREKQLGYHFLYVVDTFDIVENYLPYSKTDIFSGNKSGVLAHKYVCYDHFFGNHNKENTILLDEYKSELTELRLRLSRDLRVFNNTIQNIETLRKHTEDFSTNLKDAQEYVDKNFENLMLILVLAGKKNNILSEFYLFLKERINITELKIGEDSRAIESIFSEIAPTSFSVELFREFMERFSMHYISIDDIDKRNTNIRNTLTDFRAIERVLLINDSIRKKNKPYKVIYFSSASKTAKIMDLFNAASSDSRPQNVHRTIYHYFLLDLLWKAYDKNPDGGIAMLDSLKSIVQHLKTNKSFEDSKEISKAESFLSLMQHTLEDGSYGAEKNLYQAIYNNNYKDNLDKHFDLIPETMRIAFQAVLEQKKSIEEFNLSISQLNQTYEILDASIQFEDYTPAYKYGKDIIKDPFHHLPYLPFLFNDYNIKSHLLNKLYDFLNNACSFDPNKRRKVKMKLLLWEIMNDIVSLDKSDNHNLKLLKSLLTTYLNFVAQRKNKTKEDPDSDRERKNTAEEKLEHRILADIILQFEITSLQSYHIEVQEEDEKKMAKVIRDSSHPFSREMTYILMWLYRRDEEYGPAIKVGVEFLTRYPKDPRISHGLGLAYVANLYRSIKPDVKKSHLIEQINTAIKYLKDARDHYHPVKKGVTNPDLISIITKNQAAICNLLADLHIRLIQIDEKINETYLINARFYIGIIDKLLTNDLHLDYKQNATYNATEFECEYFEGLQILGAKEITLSKYKTTPNKQALESGIKTLSSAKKRAEDIKRLPDYDLYVDKFFRDKEKDIDEWLESMKKNIITDL